MKRYSAAFAALALACGGGDHQSAESGVPQTAAPGARSAAAAPAAATGTVHDVDMLVTPDGQYVFRPADLTIQAGDAVRWKNVSGFPHNVAFYENRIPEGAKVVLEAVYNADPGKLGPLSGRLLLQANEVYEVSFAGAPAGTYAYFCTPHEALGMKGTITVTP
jgi:plastocyanin